MACSGGTDGRDQVVGEGSSQLSALLEVLPLLVLLLLDTTEPDMVVDERDTLAPESFITMAKVASSC